MVCVRSTMMVVLIDGGIEASSLGSVALMCSTVSITLAPGCLKISRTTPSDAILKPADEAVLGDASMARPMSLTRIGAPAFQPTMTFLYWAALVSWSLS